ncbi:hypothetical protein [Parafrankia sp. EUN1f]|uniref:hypothetical protein n=1 Tax=Parafrankia sp. EUN1f TaxID=102897 RepID=UPI0012FCCD67|nr:hypothetical protein [Parafrankia sp. EUN1f]
MLTAGQPAGLLVCWASSKVTVTRERCGMADEALRAFGADDHYDADLDLTHRSTPAGPARHHLPTSEGS